MKTAIKPLALATALSVATMAGAIAPAQADVSGNIGVFSSYVLRGITNFPENDGAALQGGVDWDFGPGFYLGYWGSSLGYGGEGRDVNGFENDFYGGWGGSTDLLSWDIGATYYYYLNISDFNAFEPKASFGVGPVTLGAKYLAEDVVWGNKGDTYWTLDAAFDIGKGFTLGGLLGYYTYETSGKYIPEVPEAKSSAFRHFDITLSHPIGDSNADANLTYIIGGEDRFGFEQKNQMVFSVTYGFDIFTEGRR
ncbi:MAG: TorF family putative porin [Nitrosomonadaceae bacterium]